MENKPQIGIVAPEADITLLLSELGKKSPIIFSLADILPVPFETESYPFVLGGADGVILAARIEQVEDVENIVEIVKTCKLVRQSERFRTLIAIVLWGEAAEESSLSIAHPNVLVCNPETKHLPPSESLAKVLQAELPNIETIDWVDRYDFIAKQFSLKKAIGNDQEISEKLNSLQQANQKLENQIVKLKNDLETQTSETINSLTKTNQNLEQEITQLKEDFAEQREEKLRVLEETSQNLENQLLQLKTNAIAEKDEKLHILQAKEDLENQLLKLTEDFTSQTNEKTKSLLEEKSNLEKEITKLKKDSSAQNDERIKSLQKANKLLEKELTQTKQHLAEKDGEFEQIIALKNIEIENLRDNKDDIEKINALSEVGKSLQNEVAQLKEKIVAERVEKIKVLEASQKLENQLIQLKDDFTKQNDEKLNSLQQVNEKLENQLAQLQNDLETQTSEKISVLTETNQSLEQKLAQLKEDFTSKNEEFEALIFSKNSEIEELQNNNREVKIINALQEDNEKLENQLAQLRNDLETQTNEKISVLTETNQQLENELVQLKEDFAVQSKALENLGVLDEANQKLEKELLYTQETFALQIQEFEELINLKNNVIENLQNNEIKANLDLENQLAQLKKDFITQNDEKIKFLEKDNKILDYQLQQLKKDFATQADEFEKFISLKDALIEDLRNSKDEENKKTSLLLAKLNNELETLKANKTPDFSELENKLLIKTNEIEKLNQLQSQKNIMLEESNSQITELKAKIADISKREKLLQKDLSDLITHLREEFLNSSSQLTGKDIEIRQLREQLERQNELAEVVLKSTKGKNIAALRLEIDKEFSEDKPLYQIYSQLSLLREECESLLKEKESIQADLNATKKNSKLETTKNNKHIAKKPLKTLQIILQNPPQEEIKIELPKSANEKNKQVEQEEELLEIEG
jgi:hypothetical protein